MRPALLAACAALLVLPGQSAAATVTYTPPQSDGNKGGLGPPSIAVRAGAGEVNDITVEPQDASGLRVIRDAGAPLDGNCERLDARALRCPGATVAVDAGDGDDRVRGATTANGAAGNDELEDVDLADGGDGDDVLTGVRTGFGGPGADRLIANGAPRADGSAAIVLHGGAGDDVLVDGPLDGALDPGPGRDVVLGGGGDDTIYDEDPEPAADRLDGGGGADLLHLGDRVEGARIDLAAQATSDGDVLAGFEGANGGLGDDVVTGDDGPNRILGGGGDDRLWGAGGNDRLVGGSGFDRFDAGPGDDRVDALTRVRVAPGDPSLDGRPEPIACGPGDDVIVELHEDLVRGDCERLPLGLSPRPESVRRRVIELRIPCPRTVPRARGRCTGSVTVADARAEELGSAPRPARGSFSFAGRQARVEATGPEPPPPGAAIITVRYGRRGDIAVRWIVPRLR